MFDNTPNFNTPKVTSDPGHQSDGVSEKPIAIVAFSVAASIPVIMLILWLQFRSSESARYRGLAAPMLASPQSQPDKSLPEPQLEINPGANLAKLRSREDSELNSYEWISRSSNIIRIPVERAMELISQHGIPVSEPAQSNYELILEHSRDRNLAPMKEAK